MVQRSEILAAASVCILAACGLVAGQNLEADTQIYDFRFKMPAGWHRVENGAATLIVPPDLPSGKSAFIALGPGDEYQRDMQDWMEPVWASMKSSYSRVIREQSQAERLPNGYDAVSRTMEALDVNGRRVSVTLTAARWGTKVEAYLFRTDAPELMPQLQDGIDTFTKSLRFRATQQETTPAMSKSGKRRRRMTPLSDAPPGPPAALTTPQSLPPGVLDGVYAGTSLRAYYSGAQTRFLVFFPDGSAIGGLPDDGMDGFNAQAYAQRLAQRGPINNLFGRYQVTENRVDIAWGDFAESWWLQSDGGGNLRVLVPVCRCDGARFSGLYQWGPYSLQFSADGAFVDRGAIDVVAAFDMNHPKIGQGTYMIGNNTLYLDYADGRRIRTSFAAPANQQGSSRFEWIAIKQKTALRQGY